MNLMLKVNLYQHNKGMSREEALETVLLEAQGCINQMDRRLVECIEALSEEDVKKIFKTWEN